MEGIDKMTLRFLYVENRLSIDAIAEGFALPRQAIVEALERWNIPNPSRRSTSQHPQTPFDEATLRYLYIEQGHTIQEIASLYAITRTSVISAMNYWEIPRRRPGPRRANKEA